MGKDDNMQTTGEKAAKVRLNLDLTPRAIDQLDALVDRTEAASRVEVVRRALSLYDLAVTHAATKGRFVLESADGKWEVLRIL